MKYEILMDKEENPSKCSIAPLKDRADFHLRYFRRKKPIEAFSAEILLHINGADIRIVAKRKIQSLAVIDCNWKHVEDALSHVERPLPELVSFPSGAVTAYPRKNKQGLDPTAGLATIEAVFIAAAFLGDWDETLLDKYHFKTAFLEANDSFWKTHSLGKNAAQK